MNRGVASFVLALGGLLAFGDAVADLTSVQSTPRQVRLNAGGPNVVSISWRVSTTADHRAGVFSPGATIIDPSTRSVLLTVRTSFDGGGAGPYTFRETVRLDTDIVRAWSERGIRQVLLQRSFGDPVGIEVDGTAVLRIDRSRLQAARDAAPAGLDVTALRLEFDSGNNAVVRDVDEPLRATATVQYTGTGVLRGRWQVAEPESPDASPLYRTLALVNTNLQTSQRSTLRSPPLPTSRSGRYLVRFCVTSQATADVSGDAQCPNPRLIAQATYRVQGKAEDGVSLVRGLTPDRQAADGNTVFGWRPLPGAQVYRLQVFALAPAQASLPASREQAAGAEPEFVTGVLLDGSTNETQLSELVQGKLEAGRRYLWRVTAHDDAGRTIGQSEDASFVFR